MIGRSKLAFPPSESEAARSTEDALDRLQRVVDELLAERDDIRVLDAGAGSATHVRFGPRARVVGIDESRSQLERNASLQETIVGDIQTHRFSVPEYGAVVCWDVLEHLPHPVQALDRLTAALKEGGILILALPNVLSVKGFVTKFTPLAFHVWFKRTFYGWKEAGTGDSGPFKTYLRYAIRPSAICAYAARNGLSVRHLDLYEASSQQAVRAKMRLSGWVWRAIRQFVRTATLGTIDAERTDVIMVFVKEAAELSLERVTRSE